ncbi:hypothetical protein [Saccharopolyspora hattusasensis]
MAPTNAHGCSSASGRDFYISVDHAERGAELVNALITESSAL